ncbi:DUF3237 family protein [Nocardia beijingensis]|uniref:DUF3237 family protein n=1 Tax=Nocardia beijingensis TaxID=95162 RepID=UPI0033285BEB
MLASAGARVPSVPGLRGIHILSRDAGCAAHPAHRGRRLGAGDLRRALDRAGGRARPDRDPATRHLVDSGRYYFRTTPVFETGARNYRSLNDIVCVGSGYPVEGGNAYPVFEVV